MSTYKFLTNSPLVKLIRSDEWEELHILEYGTDPVTLRGCLEIDLLAGGSVQYTYTDPFTAVGSRFTFCVKPPYTILFSTIKTMRAYVQNLVMVNGSPVWNRCTEIRTFTADQSLRKRTYRIGFVNLLGGIDFYTFYGSETKTGSVTQTTVLKELPFPLNKSDRGQKLVSSNYLEDVEIFSDFINETMALWLSELLTSPEVWRVEYTSNIPIIVTLQNQVVVSDNLLQMQFSFQDANQRITQNG